MNKREKVFLLATVGVIALRVAYDLILNPYLAKINNLDKEISRLENKLSRALQMSARDNEIKEAFRGLGIEGQGADKISSPEQQLADVLIEIERVARKFSIRINDIKPQPLRKHELCQELVIEVRLDSGIKEIAGFLYQLRQSSRLFTVDKFELSRPSQEAPSIYGYLEIHKILL